jgi:hypothetical protein
VNASEQQGVSGSSTEQIRSPKDNITEPRLITTMDYKSTFYWDSDTITELQNSDAKEIFDFVYRSCEWDNYIDLANVFTDLIKTINNVK